MISFNFRDQKHTVIIDNDNQQNICTLDMINGRRLADKTACVLYANYLMDISTAGFAGLETRKLAAAILAAAQK